MLFLIEADDKHYFYGSKRMEELEELPPTVW